MRARGIVFDLDDTLVDTRALRDLRTARNWKEAVSRMGQTSLFPGIEDLLQYLRQGGVPWAVVTTSVSYYAEKVLAYHGLGRPLLVAYHDAPAKPDPAPVRLALSRLGLSAGDVVGVGDSLADLAAYRSAGILAVGAGWSPSLIQCDWDAIVDHPARISAEM